MALVNISDAAKLVRKARTTLMRDIESGRLSKTVLQDGDVRIDTAELLRFYGRLHNPQATPKPRESRKDSADKTKIALLEERIRSLERVITLEAELRRVKDQVTSELRMRLADKDHMIKILESKILFLEFEYDKQTLQSRSVPTLEPEQVAPSSSAQTERVITTAAHPAHSAPAASTAKTSATPAATPAPASASAKTQPASSGTGKAAATAAPPHTAKAAPNAGARPEKSAAPVSPQQQTTATTKPATTTIHTYTAPARAVPGAPGGVERRRSVKAGNWWQRLFGAKPRNE